MAVKSAPARKDVLVTTLCLLMLCACLGAIGNRGRRQARDAVCRENLRRWHPIFRGYVMQNDGKFLTGIDDQGFWWPLQLKEEHLDWTQNRIWLCPEASIPTDTGIDLWDKSGGVFSAWGVYQMDDVPPGNALRPHGMAGSYALNGYFLNISGNEFESHVSASAGWKRPYDVSGSVDIPLFTDGIRFDTWPSSNDGPTATESTSWQTVSQMGRCAINRHNGCVNSLFLDGSARKVGLKELWTLKWHRSFDTSGRWTVAGGVQSTDWPQWMCEFKDY